MNLFKLDPSQITTRLYACIVIFCYFSDSQKILGGLRNHCGFTVSRLGGFSAWHQKMRYGGSGVLLSSINWSSRRLIQTLSPSHKAINYEQPPGELLNSRTIAVTWHDCHRFAKSTFICNWFFGCGWSAKIGPGVSFRQFTAKYRNY